ncbi:hypothetical protein evm_015188 [Chilo suppressalis]|nr:hypothetical protein evm_015188 [Chilo suppressalis]
MRLYYNSRKVNSRNFVFGAPISDTEQSEAAIGFRVAAMDQSVTANKVSRPAAMITMWKRSCLVNECFFDCITLIKQLHAYKRPGSSWDSNPHSDALCFRGPNGPAVEPDLIGDFSQPFLLPLTAGHHPDLRSISCDTLANLLNGIYRGHVENYKVIDCRYPYEFDGGHIKEAINLYTPAQVQALVSDPRIECGTKRNILVFHCEFSLERGPKLSRFLRSSDRAKNKENYPSLHYPEVYLLHEGYHAFYKKYPNLCSPAGYTAMLDPKHKDSLKKHRSVSQPASSIHHRRHRLLL